MCTEIFLAGKAAQAQGYQRPAAFFPAGHSFCDTAGWKLVFEDDFEAPALKVPWVTFNSWAHMPGGDNPNWPDARANGISVYLDKNVFLNNGTAVLQAWREPAFWRCDTCTAPPLVTSYSTATLALPYTHSFNEGRFEARIKMPVFKWAHSTFWTWAGSTVNEIDIAEAYGISKNYLRWATAGKPHVDYSLHSWPAPADTLLGAVHEAATSRYPRQEGIRGRNRFKPGDFHVYTCEWDTAVIRFFLDGELVQEQWKYYIDGRPSNCVAAGGTYSQLPAFPYNNESLSNLRFTIAVDRADRRHRPGLLGEMVIDYVRIWQRHPRQETF